MEERYKATLYLHTLGDIIGFKNSDWEFNNGFGYTAPLSYTNEILYEFISLGGINRLDVSKWIASDDTIFHLATAEGLLKEHDNLNKLCDILSQKYIKELENKNMKKRYPGKTMSIELNRIKKGLKWNKIEYSNYAGGSGASMKSSCIGLAFHGKKNREKLVTTALEISRITHNNSTGYLGGITSALFTAFAIENIKIDKWPFLLLDILASGIIENYLQKTRGLNEYIKDRHIFINKWRTYIGHKFDDSGIKQNRSDKNIIFRCNYYLTNFKSDTYKGNYIGSGGDDSVIIAYDCLIDCQKNWEKLVIYSMLHIGDSDTTGAIAASWYGALYGFYDIPKHYLSNIEFEENIKKLSKQLYSVFHNKTN